MTPELKPERGIGRTLGAPWPLGPDFTDVGSPFGPSWVPLKWTEINLEFKPNWTLRNWISTSLQAARDVLATILEAILRSL